MAISVFLADDHNIIREGLRAILATEPDIQVVGEAGNGRDAVRLAGKLRPQVIVMDVSMPDTNGIDATSQIAAENPNVSIIALSMHSDRHFIADMLAAGARGYLLKDSAADELIRAIRTVVDGRMYLSPDIAHLIVNGFVQQTRQENASARDVLTSREIEVCQLISEGMATKEIAFKLNVSVKTVESHRKNIFDKLHIDNIADLTKYAIRHRITSVER